MKIKILILTAAVALLAGCVTCFNPFSPTGFDLSCTQPKETCGDFCGGDSYCIQTQCHGDPNTTNY